MGANSSHASATDEKLVDLPLPGEESALDLPTPPSSNDEPLLDLSNVNVKNMKKRPCSVDPKLAANPKRKAPPINPKTCKEGSVAKGKDDEFYVIKSGKWQKVSKRIEERKREMLRSRLSEMKSRTNRARARVSKPAATPKRGPGRPKKSSPSKRGPGRPKKSSPSKRGPGRPKGSKSKKSVKTPMRKRCPKGSRKSKTGKSCTKK
mgnify:CR=1 FL=1